MNYPSLYEVIRSSRTVVRKGRFAYLKAREAGPGDHFQVARNEDEVTIVTEEANVGCIAYDSDVEWFLLIEIRVSLPFFAKGFFAVVTEAIAGNDLNVLVVSTFSKDYFFVREESLQTALGALEEFGFPVARDEV